MYVCVCLCRPLCQDDFCPSCGAANVRCPDFCAAFCLQMLLLSGSKLPHTYIRIGEACQCAAVNSNFSFFNMLLFLYIYLSYNVKLPPKMATFHILICVAAVCGSLCAHLLAFFVTWHSVWLCSALLWCSKCIYCPKLQASHCSRLAHSRYV